MTPVWIAVIVVGVFAAGIIVLALCQVAGTYDERDCEDYLKEREE